MNPASFQPYSTDVSAHSITFIDLHQYQQLHCFITPRLWITTAYKWKWSNDTAIFNEDIPVHTSLSDWLSKCLMSYSTRNRSLVSANLLASIENYYTTFTWWPFSKTTWVSQYQKGKPFWMLMKQEMMEWQWHQLNHMQIIWMKGKQAPIIHITQIRVYSAKINKWIKDTLNLLIYLGPGHFTGPYTHQ